MKDQGQRRGGGLRPVAMLLALALLLLLPSSALAAGGWLARTSGTQQDLAGLAVSGAHLWAVGAGGTILASQNDGATWNAQGSGTTRELHAVAFADGAHGWAVGDGGTVVATADGGTSWMPQTSPSTQDLHGVAFADGMHGWAVGAGGTILATADGGTTWTVQTSPSTQDLSGVACSSASTAWAVGAGGTILASTDGGATWTAQTAPSTQELHAVAFADDTRGWAVGAAGTIVATADGGATWTAQVSRRNDELAGVACADPVHAWVVGGGGTVLYTANGGVAWTAQTVTTQVDFAGIAFADAHRGGIAGAGGVVLTTGDGGIVDTRAPHTSARGLHVGSSSGWRNTGQAVELKAGDVDSGVAATYYRIDGGSRRRYTAPFVVSAAGSHLVKYWSVDWAGNVEAKHTGYVNIDTGRPTCIALGNVKMYTGASATFRFRVNDPAPTCGRADVRITISKSGTVKKRFKLGHVTLNKARQRSFRLGLSAGSYTWRVTATDLAGNRQVKVGTAKLTIVVMPLPTIAAVQRRLVALRYLPSGAVSGKSDYRTSQAVMAFQAWSGLTRDGIPGVKTRARLAKASAPRPRAGSVAGHYVEVFRSLGVALCVDSGSLVRVVHCSTGRPGLETTPGSWRVYLKSEMFWSREYSSWMPYASFFHNGEGLHGYGDVPAYPASHGCVRLPMPEAPWVYGFAAIGTPVFVY